MERRRERREKEEKKKRKKRRVRMVGRRDRGVWEQTAKGTENGGRKEATQMDGWDSQEKEAEQEQELEKNAVGIKKRQME